MNIIKRPDGFPDYTVEFDEDRPIRILQMTDTQIADMKYVRNENRSSQLSACYFPDGNKDMESRCFRVMRALVSRIRPDLIVLTGDNVYGEADDAGTMLTAFAEVMESFGIPWMPIFGNHDNESAMGVDWQCRGYENAPHCLFSRGAVTGNCTYSVLLRTAGKPRHLLCFFDSNGCREIPNPGEGLQKDNINYDKIVQRAGIYPDQVEWFEKTAQAVGTETRNAVPCSLYTHIGMQCMTDLLRSRYGFDRDTEFFDAFTGEDFGYMAECTFRPVDRENALYNAALSHGLRGIFFGHEHNNAVSVKNDDGIRLTFGMKTGWVSYQPFPMHSGGTVVTVDREGGLSVAFEIED